MRRSRLAGGVLAATLGAAAAPTPAPDAFREVRPGETLWVIAGDLFGDPHLWPVLYRANRDQIKDPSKLYPGQKLAVPRLEPGERQAVREETRERP
jgi:nucleoid-associated protein YgaU